MVLAYQWSGPSAGETAWTLAQKGQTFHAPSVYPYPYQPAAIYRRVSTNRQEDGYSLTTQEASCRAHAEANGYAIVPDHIYIESHTGVDLWSRPKLNSLRKAI